MGAANTTQNVYMFSQLTPDNAFVSINVVYNMC